MEWHQLVPIIFEEKFKPNYRVYINGKYIYKAEKRL